MARAPIAAPSTSDYLARIIGERCEELFKAPERSSSQSLWEELSRFILPHDSSYTEISPQTGGILRKRDLLDSTAMRSLELFASSIHSLMNNPSTQWFRLGVAGEKKRDLPTGQQRALDDMSTELLKLLTARGMNLYSHLHSAYLSLGAFGTACIYMGDLGEEGVHIREFPMADIAIDENAIGKIDTVFRREMLSLRQVVQRWPDRPIEQLGTSIGQPGQAKQVEIIHAVFPSDELGLLMAQHSAQDTPDDEWFARAAQAQQVHPWLSVWINKTDTVTLGVGGFPEFPYMVPRWYVARGEVYGRSPGMTVLPDARMTNRMMDTIVRGAEKLVDPPLMLPHGSLVSPLRVWPGSISYTDGIVSPQPLIPPGASRVEYGQEILITRQQAIREGFFTPLFATPDSPVKTATQVLQEADERNRAIAPMLIRLQEELFHPLLFRAYHLFARKGLLEIDMGQGVEDLDIEYVSPLVAAHKQTESLGAIRAIESALAWAQVDPAVMDIWEPKRVAMVIHDGSGMPSDTLRSRSEMDALERAREQERQQAQSAAITPAVEAGAKVRQADAAMLKAMQ